MKWYKAEGIEYTGGPFIKKVKIGTREICLVATDQELFALSARCPHAGEDLSRGWCKDGKLVCPVHRFSYDLHTGKGSPGQNDFVESYKVEVKPDGIYIGIETFWEKLKQGFK